MNGITNQTEAGFHPELLPTWDGKAENILKQPKCWSSRSIISRIREKQLARAPSVAQVKHVDQQLPPQLQALLLEDSLADSFNKQEEDHHLVVVDGLEGNGNEESTDSSASTSLALRTKLNTQHATNRVAEKCNELREDPNAVKELMKRIATRRKKERRGTHRNLIIENKWLNDDKRVCKQYWEEVRSLKKRIEEANAVDVKLALYALWPHPPTENHSQDGVKEKMKKRSSMLTNRIQTVQNNRAKLEKERMTQLDIKVNRRDVAAEEYQRKERQIRLRNLLTKLALVAKSGTILSEHLQETRFKTEENKRIAKSATVIQRRWKNTKATQSGLKFRNAIKIIRKFARRSAEQRRADKLNQAAKTICWFLTLYENSNFQKVMRNYRFRVVNCQRYFREYQELTKFRLKVLTMKWDRVEREKIRTERSRAMLETRRLVTQTAELTNGAANHPENRNAKAAIFASGMNAKEMRLDAPSSAMLSHANRGKSKAKFNVIGNGGMMDGKRGKMVQQSRANLFKREQSTQQEHAPQSNAAAIAAAVEMGVHVQRKVPKQVKKELLNNHLMKLRKEFRREWVEYCKNSTVMKAQAGLMTIDDVRSVLHAESSSHLFKVLDEKMENYKPETKPTLMLFTKTSDDVLNELIERGRAIADENFFDGLSEDQTDEHLSKYDDPNQFVTGLI